MQLSQETIDFISNVIRVAKILKIENVIFDKEAVRGDVKQEGTMLIQRDNLPDFEFESLGISRIGTLDTRLNLLGGNCTIDAEEKNKSPTEKVIYKLVLSNDKTEVDFKCADPAMMPKSPKNLKDPTFFTFKISEETIALLSKAQNAIRSDLVSFTGSKNGVVSKLSDVEGDLFNHIVCEELTMSPECDKTKFYYSYKNKILLPLLREAIQDDNLIINITKRGILNVKVLNLNVFITPEI